MAKKSYFIVKWPTPPGLSQSDRVSYWKIAAEAVLARKDKDLARGLAADGKPLGRPSERWLKRRRSKMTPDGSGDRNAPLFAPGNRLSRVRSLLTSRGYDGWVRVWWRFDPLTGAEWGEVLARWAETKGRRWDVLGMAKASILWARTETDRRWKAFKAGDPSALPAPPSPGRPLPVERSERRPTVLDLHSGDAAEIARAAREGRFSGWRTADELRDWWRSGRTTGDFARPAQTAPSIRDSAVTNTGLRYTWEIAPGGPRSPATSSPPSGLFRRVFGRVGRAFNRFFNAFGI